MEDERYYNGKVYKLTTPHSDMVYVGSTIATLVTRKSKHKHVYNKYKDDKVYGNMSCKLYELGADDVKIELIEDYPCGCKKDLETRERYWIEKTPNCVNMIMPTRKWEERSKEEISKIRKEYYEKNKEKMREAKRKDYLKHKEERNAKGKEYYKKNKEQYLKKCAEYLEKNREKRNAQKRQHYAQNKEKLLAISKQYREENKESLKVSQAQWRKDNAEIIKQKKNAVEACECGLTYTVANRSRHKKSKKHIKLMEGK